MKLALPERNIIRILAETAEYDETDVYTCLSENIYNDDRILYESKEICNKTDEYVAKLVELIKNNNIEELGLEFDFLFPTPNPTFLKRIGIYDKLNHRFKEDHCLESDYRLFIEQVRRACAGNIDRLRKIDLPIVYGLLRVRLKGFEPKAPKMHIGLPQPTNRKYRETQYLSQLNQSEEGYSSILEGAPLYEITRGPENDRMLEEYYNQKKLVSKMDGVIVQADEFFEKLNIALEEYNLALMIGEETLTYEKYVLYTLSGICDEKDVKLNRVKTNKQKRMQVIKTTGGELQRLA